jgi:hypothetical protein
VLWIVTGDDVAGVARQSFAGRALLADGKLDSSSTRDCSLPVTWCRY